MELSIENDYQYLKKWATECMEYVPRDASLDSNFNGNDFHSKLISGRLGIYWKYLIRHARSRSQIQHIRDNLKIQEFQDAKNKKNAKILALTSDTDVTIKVNKPLKRQQDISSMSFELDSSNISNRSLLIKEFDETRHLLKKSSSKIERTKLEIKSILEECEELKIQKQEHDNHTDHNFEKLGFLRNLKENTRNSINEITKYSQFMEQTMIQRFDLSKPKHYEKHEQHVADMKNRLLLAIKRCKDIVDKQTRSENDQKSHFVSAQILNEVKITMNDILLPKGFDESSNVYHASSFAVNEWILLYIRSIVRTLDANLAYKDKATSLQQNELQDILDSWREKHVSFVCEASALASEVKELENDNRRQIKHVLTTISDIVDSDTPNSYSSTELKTILQRYFSLLEKYSRVRSVVQELNKNLIKRQHTIENNNLKVLYNSSSSNANLIEGKKIQIKRLLQKNVNLDVRYNWLELKILGILNEDIVNNIRHILYQKPTNPTGGQHLSASQDRVRRLLNNFICYPNHLQQSLNVSNRVCGRDITWLLNSIKNLYLYDKRDFNSLLMIENFLQLKSLMKSVDKFITEAKFIEQNFSFFEENMEGHNTEKKISQSKDHTELINKIDDIIEQVKTAQKHFGMKI